MNTSSTRTIRFAMDRGLAMGMPSSTVSVYKADAYANTPNRGDIHLTVAELDGAEKVMLGHNSSHEWYGLQLTDGRTFVVVVGDGELIKFADVLPAYIGHF